MNLSLSVVDESAGFFRWWWRFHRVRFGEVSLRSRRRCHWTRGEGRRGRVRQRWDEFTAYMKDGQTSSLLFDCLFLLLFLRVQEIKTISPSEDSRTQKPWRPALQITRIWYDTHRNTHIKVHWLLLYRVLMEILLIVFQAVRLREVSLRRWGHRSLRAAPGLNAAVRWVCDWKRSCGCTRVL